MANESGFLIGMILLGVSFSGGNVAWSLWVTKIAPPDLVADYMAVHTFMTGLRGIVAPGLAVYGTQWMPIEWLVTISSLMILASIIMMGPELRTWKKRRPGERLSEGIGE
jgi:hypothetical protein